MTVTPPPDVYFPDLDRAVERLIEEWLSAQRSQNTADSYRRAIGMWMDWLAGRGVGWKEVRRKDANEWARWMDTSPHGRHKKPASPATVNQRLSAVSSFYDYAVEEEVEGLDVNRVKTTTRHLVDAQHSDTFTPSVEEAKRIIAEARVFSPRMWAFTALLASTGARVSEVLGADVEKHLRTEMGARVLRVRRKRGKIMHLPVLPGVGAAVDAYLDGRTKGPLFLDRGAKRLSRQAAANEVKKIGMAAGCPRLTPHSLRHMFATMGKIKGTSVDDLQEIMGHTESSTTRRYLGALDRFENHPAEEIAKLLEMF